MADSKVYVTLEVDDKGSAVVRRFGSETNQAFDKMKEKAKSASAGMGSALQKLKQHWMAVAAASAAAVAATKKGIEAYMEQEKAEMKLAIAMRNQGDFTRANFAAMKDYAAQLQKVTTYGDEVTLVTMANLKTYGMNTEELKKATKATMDLATAKGIDLKTASDLVGKAFIGETGSLSRYGIVLEKGIPQTEKFAAVLGLINDKFGGSAQAELATYSGQWQQLMNWWGDVWEKVGLVTLKTIEGIQFAAGMLAVGFYTIVEGLVSYLAKFIHYAEGIPVIGKKFKGLADGLDSIAEGLGRAKEKALEFTNKNYTMLTSFDRVENVIERMGNATKDATDKTAELTDAQNNAAEAALKRHNILIAHEMAMSQIQGAAAVRQLEFMGKMSEALDLQIAQQHALAEAKLRSVIESPEVSYEDKLAALATFREAELQLETEYAQRKAELWWDSAQTYINFAQQMSTFAMQYLLAEEADRQAIGRRMLATAIRFLTQQLQQFMFTKAKEHLINALSAASYLKVKTMQAAAEMAIGKQMAAAWTAYFVAMSLDPVKGHAYIPAAKAMAAATAGFGAAAGGVVATGKASMAAELGMAAAWAAGGVLAGAAGETAASAIEGRGRGGEKTIGGGVGGGYTLSSPDEPQWQRQQSYIEPASVSRMVNIHIYGNVVDHDKFARELVPAIQKAEADGVH